MTMHMDEKPLPKIVTFLLSFSHAQVTLLQCLKDRKDRPIETTFVNGRYESAAVALRDRGLIYLSRIDRERPVWLLTPDGDVAAQRLQEFIDVVEPLCTK